MTSSPATTCHARGPLKRFEFSFTTGQSSMVSARAKLALMRGAMVALAKKGANTMRKALTRAPTMKEPTDYVFESQSH